MYLKILRIAMFIAIFAYGGILAFGQDPYGIAKDFLADKEFSEKNHVWTTTETTISLDWKTGKVIDGKMTVIDCQHTFLNDRLRHRCVPHGQVMSGGFEPDEEKFSFDSSIIDQFTFDGMERDESGKYSVVSFRASKSPTRKIVISKKVLFFRAKADITNLVNSVLGNIEVWANGKIKAARVDLPEKVKIQLTGGSGEVSVFNAAITTQELDGRIVFKTMEFEYRIQGSVLLAFGKSEHKIVSIKYHDYKLMTVMEKSDYLAKTDGWGKVNKLPKVDE